MRSGFSHRLGRMALLSLIATDTLTVCTYTHFAPFSYEKDGKIVGTDITLLKRFARSQGLDARFEVTEFPDIWTRPGRGECDIAAAGIGSIADRDPGRGGCWSAPYAFVRRSLLVRRSDARSMRGPEDLAGRSIVVTADSAADVDARIRYAPIGANIVTAQPPQDEMVRRLLNGEIDAYAGGETSNRYLVESEPRLAVVDVHSMEPPETLHFAVRRVGPGLVEALNEFLSNIISNDN